MSSIVTFYSYKGGVGRSMALANIAYELSRKKLKVLMVDWDLEAPGIEAYFSSYFKIEKKGNGLLPMLMEVKRNNEPSYEKYLWKIKIDHGNSIDLLHSGRERDSDYSNHLENFDWNDFFSKNDGGVYLENLRKEWKEKYDLVLIDSRTGLTDISGICTIFLPDVIVPMFTANNQSLYGVRDIVRLSQRARKKLASSRMPLTILPVPTRFGRGEFKESREWLNTFAEELKEFYTDWLPKWIKPIQVLEKIKIPQIDYFSFGEKLSVVEQGTGDPEGMGYIYSKIASLLASDLKDIESLMGEQFHVQREEFTRKKETGTIKKTTRELGYEYDVFISYAQSSTTNEWIQKIFLPLFKLYISEQMGIEVRVFVDTQEINLGVSFSDTISNALKRSKILIPIINPKYLKSHFTLSELVAFLERSHNKTSTFTYPILIFGVEHVNQNSIIRNIQLLDFREYFTAGEAFVKSVKYLEFAERMKELTRSIINMLEKVPPFDPDWPSLDDKRIQTKVSELLKDDANLDLPKLS